MLLALALVQLQLAHAWNWSRALGTGSGKKQAQHTEGESCLVPGQDPEHQTRSHSHSPNLDLIQVFWRQLARGERSNKDRIH